ncbi:MAG: hypothetical protein WC284_16240 [Candidimonas sp.]
MTDVYDVHSSGKYPCNILSNFSHHTFVFDDVLCHSMEGLLQSLKFKSIEEQTRVCLLIGYDAKRKGSQKSWITTGLWWRGVPIDRFDHIYQTFLDKIYLSLTLQSISFRRALIATYGGEIIHSIGKSDRSVTILTEMEFVSRLTILRNLIVDGIIEM